MALPSQPATTVTIDSFKQYYSRYFVKAFSITSAALGAAGMIFAGLCFITWSIEVAITNLITFPLAFVFANIPLLILCLRDNPVKSICGAQTVMAFTVVFGVLTHIITFAVNLVLITETRRGGESLTALLVLMSALEIIFQSWCVHHLRMLVLYQKAGVVSIPMESPLYKRINDLEEKVNALLTIHSNIMHVQPQPPVAQSVVVGETVVVGEPVVYRT